MGRSLLIEKSVEDQVLENLYKKANFQIGLLLGQQSEPKDFVTHFIDSPDPVKEEAATEADDSGSPRKSKPSKTNKNDELFDVKWVAEHGRQVNRMLIGGISVLGMFIYCPTDVASKNQAKFSQCLHSLQMRLEPNKWLKKAYLHSDRYLLHICSATKKLTCRSIDLLDKQATAKPVECKFQSFLSNWHTVATNIDVHINVSVPLSSKATETEKSILAACRYEIDQIWNAYATENCKLLDDEQLIATNILSNTKSKSKNKQDVQIGKCMTFTLFKSPAVKKVEEVVEQEVTYLEVKFFGAIHAKAALNSKASYGKAITALKVDLIRSLLTRVELLCEEADVNNLDQVEEWSLVSPTRVFFQVPNSPAYFCDYSFKDESVDDILSRFSELLNVSTKQSELVYLERSPDVSEASMLFHLPEKPSDQQSDIVSELSNSLLDEQGGKKHIYLLVGVMVILIAILLNLIL